MQLRATLGSNLGECVFALNLVSWQNQTASAGPVEIFLNKLSSFSSVPEEKGVVSG